MQKLLAEYTLPIPRTFKLYFTGPNCLEASFTFQPLEYERFSWEEEGSLYLKEALVRHQVSDYPALSLLHHCAQPAPPSWGGHGPDSCYVQGFQGTFGRSPPAGSSEPIWGHRALPHIPSTSACVIVPKSR